jgi:hypothetical protein
VPIGSWFLRTEVPDAGGRRAHDRRGLCTFVRRLARLGDESGEVAIEASPPSSALVRSALQGGCAAPTLVGEMLSR